MENIDKELVELIMSKGTWEQAYALAERETIARNVARWHMEKEKRERKAAQDSLEAERRSMSLRQLKDYRREEWRKRNCRATLAELVAAHKQKGSVSK